MNFSRHLSDERQRLGLSQAEAASLCGVSREMWGKYERGKASPAASVLEAFARAGADVLYILTGQRTPLSVAETPAGYQVEALKPDEAALLDNYRHSSPEAQAALKATSDALAQRLCAEGKKVKK